MRLCIFKKPTLEYVYMNEPLISLDKITFVADFFSSELWMEMFNSSTWIFFFEGIGGATPLNPI
jgi:hypothetical protein